MASLLPVSDFAANPFLEASDDKSISAKFHGTEWGDNIPQKEIPLTARVVTTRIAKMNKFRLLKGTTIYRCPAQMLPTLHLME